MDSITVRIWYKIALILIALCVAGGTSHGEVQPTTKPESVAAAPPATNSIAGSSAQPAETVEQLISQLGSDAEKDRDAAQKSLTNLGSTAIPALKKAAENADDPEIRSRAGIILTAINDREATQPSLITLHAQAMPAQQALDAIGAQCDAHLVTMGMAVASPTRPAKTVTFDADQKPFWEVMPGVCQKLRISPDLNYHVRNSMRFTPTWADWITESPHQIVGPFWIGVQSITHTRTMEPGISDIPREQFDVRLLIMGEPKLDVTHMSNFVVTEASDNAGHSLMPKALDSKMPRTMLQKAEYLNHMVQFSLSYPQEQPGTMIATLEGQMVIVAAQDFQRYEVDDVMGTPHITNPLSNSEIHASVVRKGDKFEARIQCKRQNISDDQWAALTNQMGDVSLEDVNGHPLNAVSAVGIHSMSQAPGNENFQATGLFEAKSPTDPRRLVWTFPKSVNAVKVSVTFHDLKMP